MMQRAYTAGMARPVDLSLRGNLLDDLLEAVARLGLGNLSLRALGRELRVSPRMLLYHFGSRDGLLDAIVAETSRRLAAAAGGLEGPLPEVVRASWAWMTAPAQRGFLNVFYEVCALGARDASRRGIVASSLFTDWHALLVGRGVPDAEATLLLATLHGLLLDLVLTGEPARVGRALDAFVARLGAQRG
jgi:AcrR family transcriptional regulator